MTRRRNYLPLNNVILDFLSKIIGSTNLVKRFQANSLAKLFDKGGHGRLLDIGCGNGYLSFLLSENFEKVLGIDLKPNKHWKTVCDHAGNIEFKTLNEYTHTSQKFDVLLLSEVMGETGSLDDFYQFYKNEFGCCSEVIIITSFGRDSAVNILYGLNKFLGKLGFAKEKSYSNVEQEYLSKLSKDFSSNRLTFFSKKDYELVMAKGSFILEKEIYDFSKAAIFLLELIQVILLKLRLKPYGKRLFILYPLLLLLNNLPKSNQYAILKFKKDF